MNLTSDMQRYPRWDRVFSESQKRVLAETTDAGSAPQKPMAYSLGEPLGDPVAGGGGSPDYILPDSNRRILTKAELRTMGLMQLYLARNEITARKGQVFSTPMLQQYFGSRSWYRPQEDKAYAALDTIESNNALLILQVEKERGGPFLGRLETLPKTLAGLKSAPDIFPYSSTAFLNRSIVESLSGPHLALARNEIFARHGFPFKSKVLQRYFTLKPDYQRNSSAKAPSFNAVEKQNIWLIEKIERIRGGAWSWEE